MLGARAEAAHPAGSNDARMILLDRKRDGACIFFVGDRAAYANGDSQHGADGGGRCAIHRDAGPELLPTACRNFPRVSLRDRRGIFVTLSHYCPSAARLLLDAQEIAIVDAPPALSLNGLVDGLDATDVLPPLLRPGMLLDLDGYSAWESQGLAVLNEQAYPARAAVSILRAATAAARPWSPGAETLAARMLHAFDAARSAHVGQERREDDAPLERPKKAFVAAHLFASPAAYERCELTAVVDAVESALTKLETELGDSGDPQSFIAAVRRADFQLRHTSSDGTSSA